MIATLLATDGAVLAMSIVFALIGGAGIGACLGIFIYRAVQKKRTDAAMMESSKILEEARQEAKNIRKEAQIEAKEEQLRLRNDLEQELKERRLEVSKQEQRLNQREDSLQKKEDILDKKIESNDQAKHDLQLREQRIKEREEDLSRHEEKMQEELEKVSGLTKQEAKDLLISSIEEEAKKDAVIMVREIEESAKENAEKRAKNIVGLAIQRCAVDHAAETTVSVVELPSDEMKGRIIGRVGRNIKAFESATGVDVIIDDTPDVVTLTGFDPVRREIARLTLQKLVSDGRIHPGRIEEVVEKVRKEIDAQVKDAGENAAFDAGVVGLHPELIKLLGRLKYRTSYGQNVLKHSLEVSYLAGLMAGELGLSDADIKLAKRAGLLHDIGKSIDHEYEGTHVQIGAELARKYKEKEEVVNAIEAHHGDVEAKTLVAIIVQASDAISGARPGARRESIDNYVKRLEKLEAIANDFKGVEQSYAIQAGREIRVIVKPEVVDDVATTYLAKEIARKLESELEYPGQIKVNVIRELRSVEYAK